MAGIVERGGWVHFWGMKGQRPPSPRTTEWTARLCAALLVVHFGLVSLTMLPFAEGGVGERAAGAIREYYLVFPFTLQGWSMFSPPPRENFAVLVQLETPVGDSLRQSAWIDLTDGLIREKFRRPVVNSVFASLSYQLFTGNSQLMQELNRIGRRVVRDSAYANCTTADLDLLLGQWLDEQSFRGDLAVPGLVRNLHERGKLDFGIPLDVNHSRLRFRYVVTAIPDYYAAETGAAPAAASRYLERPARPLYPTTVAAAAPVATLTPAQ